MPMLAAEIASTSAKPSMILPRNRKAGSQDAAGPDGARPGDVDCCDDPTSTPRNSFLENRQFREREFPGSDRPKIEQNG